MEIPCKELKSIIKHLINNECQETFNIIVDSKYSKYLYSVYEKNGSLGQFFKLFSRTHGRDIYD